MNGTEIQTPFDTKKTFGEGNKIPEACINYYQNLYSNEEKSEKTKIETECRSGLNELTKDITLCLYKPYQNEMTYGNFLKCLASPERGNILNNENNYENNDENNQTINDFYNLINKAGEGNINKEMKDFFLKQWKKLPPEIIEKWIKSLSPESVKFLNSGSAKSIKLILDNKLGNRVLSSDEFRTLAGNFEKKFQQGENLNERESKLKKLYLDLKENLEKYYPGINIVDFFEKIFAHESGGNSKNRDMKIFAASGTGSVGPAQTISSTYNNEQIGTKFNPFNPEQAINGAMEFFLLGVYSYIKGEGKLKIARALDAYNKGIGGTKNTPDNALLNPKENRKDKHGNPYNYAYLVLYK